LSGAEHTIKKVADEATKELLAELEQGREGAENAVSGRLEQASVEVQKIKEQQVRQAEALKRQIIGAAEMNARNKSLQIIEESLDTAFSQGSRKLEARTKDEHYEKIMKKLLTEAMDQVGGEEFVVQVSLSDHKVAKKVALELAKERGVKIEVAKDPIKTIGGVKLASSDGYVMFDNTFEARLERLRPALRKQVAQLFSEQK
jgi:V/A-type H+/Na+-transporting ATPase subunit E